MVLGLATGQSEALVPMMIQEIHFIHERSTFLTWQMATQTIITAVYVLFASPIAAGIGPGNWYILGGGLAAAVLVFSIFLVPETKYNRTLAAYGQSDTQSDEQEQSPKGRALPVRVAERPALDFDRYQPRTLWSDMRVFVHTPDWMEGAYTFLVSMLPMLWREFTLT